MATRCGASARWYSRVNGFRACDQCTAALESDARALMSPLRNSRTARCDMQVSLSLNQHWREMTRRVEKARRLIDVVTMPGIVDDETAARMMGALARHVRVAARSASVLMTVDAWTVLTGDRVRPVLIDLDYDDGRDNSTYGVEAHASEQCLAPDNVNGEPGLCHGEVADYEHDWIYNGMQRLAMVCQSCGHRAAVVNPDDGAMTVLQYFAMRDALTAVHPTREVPDVDVVASAVQAARDAGRLA